MLLNRNRTRWVVAAVPLAAMLLAACDIKKDLLQPQNPGLIDASAVGTPTAALALRVGALSRYKQLTNADGSEALWEYAGTLADEYKNSDFLTDRVDIDQREIDPNNGIVTGTGGLYGTVTQSRGYIRDAITAMQKYLPDSTGLRAELWAELGFTEMSLADNFCNGIPLGHTIAGVQTFGAPLTGVQVYDSAAAHLDSAIALSTAQDAGTVGIHNTALIMKARILVALGQFSAAAAITGPVPTTFQYTQTFDATGGGSNGSWTLINSVARITVADSVDVINGAKTAIPNSLPFVSANDPRVPTISGALSSPKVGAEDQSTPTFLNLLYKNQFDPMVIASGVDARLYEAEAKLSAGDITGMMTIPSTRLRGGEADDRYCRHARDGCASEPARHDHGHVTPLPREGVLDIRSRPAVAGPAPAHSPVQANARSSVPLRPVLQGRHVRYGREHPSSEQRAGESAVHRLSGSQREVSQILMETKQPASLTRSGLLRVPTDRDIQLMTMLDDRGLTVWRRWVPIALAIMTVVVYAAAIRAPYEFDDIASIPANASIRSLSPSIALDPPTNTSVTGRPVVNYSLALNYAINEALGVDQRPDPYGPNKTVGYHVVNLLLHLGCGLLLFGIIRRTVKYGVRASGWTVDGDLLAGIVAALWLVHPIQSEAVDYLVQRTELLVSACYLGALYAAIRAWDASTRRATIAWRVAAVVVCMLGMGSKEVMVTAPIILLLYDRAFRLESWKDLLHGGARTVFYAAILATTAVSVALIAGNARSGTVGYGLGITWYEYLYTQAWAIPHYVRLIFWPLTSSRSTTDSVPSPDFGGAPGAVLLTASGGRGHLRLDSHRSLGMRFAFLGAWFFLTLAPSSSVVPIATEVAAERRVYLALASNLVLAYIAWDDLRCRAFSEERSIAKTSRSSRSWNHRRELCDPVGMWKAQHIAPDHLATQWAIRLRHRSRGAGRRVVLCSLRCASRLGAGNDRRGADGGDHRFEACSYRNLFRGAVAAMRFSRRP